MDSHRDIFISEFRTHLKIKNFPTIESWLQDFPPATQESTVKYSTINVEIKDKIPNPRLPNKRFEKDGKYSITWYDTPSPAIFWQSNDWLESKMLGTSDSSVITLTSTSENLLGRWLRHFVIVKQYIDHSLVFLHATAISKNDKTFVLVGPSGAGKTTCAYAAHRFGWKVLADETLLIFPNMNIMPFFSTIVWECRLTPQAKSLIDNLSRNNFPHESETTSNFTDYKGRLVIHPQEIVSMTSRFPITGVIALQSHANKDDQSVYQFDLNAIKSELKDRISMRSIFDMYSDDFDHWKDQAIGTYINLLNLPIHTFKHSGNLLEEIPAFISTVDSLL